jgi:hypothetical protein
MARSVPDRRDFKELVELVAGEYILSLDQLPERRFRVVVT